MYSFECNSVVFINIIMKINNLYIENTYFLIKSFNALFNQYNEGMRFN